VIVVGAEDWPLAIIQNNLASKQSTRNYAFGFFEVFFIGINKQFTKTMSTKKKNQKLSTDNLRKLQHIQKLSDKIEEVTTEILQDHGVKPRASKSTTPLVQDPNLIWSERYHTWHTKNNVPRC
jgi:hypothetical protein